MQRMIFKNTNVKLSGLGGVSTQGAPRGGELQPPHAGTRSASHPRGHEWAGGTGRATGCPQSQGTSPGRGQRLPLAAGPGCCGWVTALLLQKAINGKGGLYLRSGRQLHTAGHHPLAGSAQHLAERGEKGGKAKPEPGLCSSSLRRLPAPAARPRGGFAASRPLPRGRRGSVPQFPLPEHPAQLQGGDFPKHLRSGALP